MRVEVMEHYGLSQPIDQAGYYETAHHKQLIKDMRGAIHEGRLIAVCGVVGSGKTGTLRRLQQRGCGATDMTNFICSYCEPGVMGCEPEKIKASSLSLNMSPKPFSWSLNLSRKLR